MKLAINQPYFFPYLGYFQLIHAVDKFVVYDDVNFIKGGWINRNRILIQGSPAWFTLELLGASPNKKINEIHVGNNQGKLGKTLQCVYAKAPFYQSTIDFLEEILFYPEKNISQYLTFGLKKICAYIGITTNFCLSSELAKDCSLKGETKVRHICHLLDTNTYINPPGGRALYSEKVFREDGLRLLFCDPDPDICYPQFGQTFISNLSIIDVMMFNSPEAIRTMLDKYTLSSM